MDNQEILKTAFYAQFTRIMHLELTISNVGVHKKFEEYVKYLEKIMIHPRIINQFNLAFKQFQQESGRDITSHKDKIIDFIHTRQKNY